MVAFFVDAADILGVPKSVAAIYGICFASIEPLSFSEIQERLDISAGSISQGLRVLRETGALKAVSTGWDRRDHFEPDLALRKLVARFIEQRVDRQLRIGEEGLAHMRILIGSDASRKILQERLQSLEDWHSQGRAVLPLVRTFLKLG